MASLPEAIYTTELLACYETGRNTSIDAGRHVTQWDDQGAAGLDAVEGATIDAPGFRAFAIDHPGHANFGETSPSALDRRWSKPQPPHEDKGPLITGAPIYDAAIVIPITDPFDIWMVGRLLTRGDESTHGLIASGALAVGLGFSLDSLFFSDDAVVTRTARINSKFQAAGWHSFRITRRTGTTDPTTDTNNAIKLFIDGQPATPDAATEAALVFTFTQMHGVVDLSGCISFDHLLTAFTTGGSAAQALDMDDYCATLLPTVSKEQVT